MALHRLPANDETLRVGVFDRSFPPILTIESGDVVVMETATHWGDGVHPDTTLADVIAYRTGPFAGVGPHSVTGPIRIEGARTGDVLKIEIHRLVPRSHGFNLILPSEWQSGLLPEDFAEGRLRHFHHDLEAMTTTFSPQVRLPLRPFLGIMAVAPREEGPHSTVPPGPHGGNIDLRDLVEGTTLYLPIWADGALFVAGDAHSRQGDGEVCLTAIETAMTEAELRLTVIDGPSIERPRAESDEHWITMAFDEDLLQASKAAVRDMIDFLTHRFDLDAHEAYSLCSVTVDLSITQVVNGQRGVHAKLPKSVFV